MGREEHKGQQLMLALFPEGMFEKIRMAHLLRELNEAKKENAHLKHQRAGHMGAYAKLKNQNNGNHTAGDQE